MPRDGLLKVSILAVFCLSLLVASGAQSKPEEAPFSNILPGLQGQPLQYWLEPEGPALTWEQAMAQAQWQPVGGELNMGYEQDKVWVRQSLSVTQANSWILQLDYPLLDYVDIYLLHDNRISKQIFTGDARQFKSRERLLNDFVVKFSPNEPSEWELLIRLETEGTLMAPLKWWKETDFDHWVTQHHMLYGGFYAVLLAMAIYNLFIFVTIRERAYLYYVLTVISLMSVQLGFDGRGFAWFWPNIPHINSWFFPVVYCLYQLASLTFMESFLKLRESSDLLYKYFIVLRVVAFGNLVLVVFLPYELITPIVVLTAVVVMISGLLTGATLWFKGFTAARYFTLAWGGFLLGMLLLNFRGLGLFESSLVNTYGYLIGSLLEVVLLSFSLADRIASSQKAKRQSEKALLEEQSKHVETLRRYQDLYENAPIGNFQSDMYHKLINVNDTCARIFGFESKENMVSEVKDIRDYMLSSYSQYKALVQHAMSQGYITDRELKIRDQAGRSRWISVALRLTEVEGRKRFEGSIIDITERKNAEMERQAMEHERLHVMEQFALGIAKEINTPLGSNAATTAFIKESLDEIADSQTTGETRFNQLESFLNLSKQSLELIQQNQRRLIRVVKRFREVSAQHFGMQLNLFSLKDAINEAVENRRWNMAGWRINVDCNDEIVLHSYRRAFLLILDQLLENSSVHGFGEHSETVVTIKALQEGDVLKLQLWDKGNGVKDELLQKLVQPFFTTKRGPMGHIGLGLYMVYNLVNRLLKGRIEFYNQKEGGLTAEIVVPIKIELQSFVSSQKKADQ